MYQSVFKSDTARDSFRAVYNGILSTFPFGQRYVDTAFGQTFLLTAGLETNPPLVVLHGSCSNSVFMTPELAALSGSYRVFAVDIVGEAGNSAEFRPELTSDAYALWLKDVLDGLGVPRAVIVGNSLGGWTALKFATAFPDRVSSLCLISPGGLSGQNREITDKAIRARDTDETLSIDDSITAGAALPKEVLDFMNLIFASYNPITDVLPVFSDDELRRLTMPVLFVGGAQDVMLDAPGAAARVKALLPHAAVHLLENAGHMILNTPEFILPFLLKGRAYGAYDA